MTFPWLEHLWFGAYDVVAEVLTPMFLPPFKGSALRGGLSRAFRKLCCIRPKGSCRTCVLRTACVYSRTFESPNPLPWHRSPTAPVPYILEPPEEAVEEFSPGEELRFGLVLVGEACSHLPYFVLALERLGAEMGLGRGKTKGSGRYRLKEVRQRGGARVYSDGKFHGGGSRRADIWLKERTEGELPGSVCIRFLTPARLHFKGRNYFPGSDGFRPSVFLESLYRRLYLLAALYGDTELPPLQVPAFPDVPPLDARVSWKDWERYSCRQGTRMKLGGLVGEVVLGEDYRDWFPLIYLGEALHVGKATSFGLGRYEVMSSGPERGGPSHVAL